MRKLRSGESLTKAPTKYGVLVDTLDSSLDTLGLPKGHAEVGPFRVIAHDLHRFLPYPVVTSTSDSLTIVGRLLFPNLDIE